MTTWVRVYLVGVAVVACGGVLDAQQQSSVRKNVNLRPTASTTQPPVRLLVPPEPLTLLEPNPTAGYFHVRTSRNEDGWVWGRNITFPPPVSLFGPGGEPGAVAAPLEAFATTAAFCPPVGRNKQGEKLSDKKDDGLRNMAKRHLPIGVFPRLLTFADFEALQADVETATHIDPKAHKFKFEPSRALLHNLVTPAGSVSEGEFVQVVGFIHFASDEHPESVNCYGDTTIDIHINLGAKTATEFQGIVLEMIPQVRPPGWTAAVLKKIQAQKLEILAAGSLTYDNEHLVNGDAAHPKAGGQPKRMSLWEVHPITEFYVCELGPCDPANHLTWTTLTAWAIAHPH